MAEETPVIEQRENGPLLVKHLKNLRLPDGTEVECKPVMALCRCGQSRNKPYCDGSHKDVGFESAPCDVSSKDKIYSYKGAEATVYFSKLLCAHAGECGARALNVFNPAQKPWIQPDAGTLDQIKEVVAACPSGALSYSTADNERQRITTDDVAISVQKNGPYHVQNIAVDAAYWADGQTAKSYVLCRCGLSGNKPFCDGTHYDKGWNEDS